MKHHKRDYVPIISSRTGKAVDMCTHVCVCVDWLCLRRHRISGPKSSTLWTTHSFLPSFIHSLIHLSACFSLSLSLSHQYALTISSDRVITGGAGGETEAAFAVQNTCTLVWSNEKSWVRPRTIKYFADIVAIPDN